MAANWVRLVKLCEDERKAARVVDRRWSILVTGGEEIISFLLPFHLLRFFRLLAERITSWRFHFFRTRGRMVERKSEKNAAKEEEIPKMNPENHRFPNTNNHADSSSLECVLKDGWELGSNWD